MEDVLTAEQRRVTDLVLGQEKARRSLVAVALSGAHAYGFPSPDSDLDLKAIHVAPAASFLGLSEPKLTFDRQEIVDGVEIDFTSNELGHVLRGLLKGNGNYLERVLGKHLLVRGYLLEQLAEYAREAISTRYASHYLGFANQQLKDFNERSPTAKSALYVLRTALTGAHLMRSGELRVDLSENLDEYDFGDARELIQRKVAGERVELDEAAAAHWRKRLLDAMSTLESARDGSELPEGPSNAEAVEDWLRDVRITEIRAM